MPAATDPASVQSRRFVALEKAQRARRARAELKRQVAAGERDVGDVLLNPPADADSMRVGELLRCQRGWGSVRTLKALRCAELSEYKELRRLTERQVRVLIGVVRSAL